MPGNYFIFPQFLSTPGLVTTVPLSTGVDLVAIGVALSSASPGFRRTVGFISIVQPRQINNETFNLEMPVGQVFTNPSLLPSPPLRRPTLMRFRQDEGFRQSVFVRFIVEL